MTPPKQRSQMIRLIKFCDSLLQQMINYKAGDPDYEVRADLLAESMTAFDMSHRWRAHPSWPMLQGTLKSGEAPHTIMLLAIASALADADNGIGLHVGTGEKIADLWVQADLNTKVDVELKTPEPLRLANESITEGAAVRFLERNLKRSQSQRRSRNNMLALGGYHLANSFDVLKAAAEGVLEGRRHRSRGLVGILLVDCSYEMSTGAFRQEQFNPQLRVEFVPHPGFSGEIGVLPATPRSVDEAGWRTGA